MDEYGVGEFARGPELHLPRAGRLSLARLLLSSIHISHPCSEPAFQLSLPVFNPESRPFLRVGGDSVC